MTKPSHIVEAGRARMVDIAGGASFPAGRACHVLKAIDRRMMIEGIETVSRSGGTSGSWPRP
jgi:molybdenum cofactor biosynthesis enzyme